MQTMKTNKTGRIRPARRLLGDLALALAALLTADVTVIMLRRIASVVLKADYQNIFRHELILCAVLLLAALDLRFGIFTARKGKVLKGIGWALRSAILLGTAVILFFFGKVTVGGLIHTAQPAEHAIVLGMALQNGKPTEDLLSRLDTAQRFLEQNPDATLILTGGNAGEDGRTEAAVMRDLLLERGVSEERVRLEDQAKTTKENFRNTARMIDPAQPVVLISSNYHMARAVRTAKSAGFARILRLPAPSDPLSFGANIMWEVILDLNELKLGV